MSPLLALLTMLHLAVAPPVTGDGERDQRVVTRQGRIVCLEEDLSAVEAEARCNEPGAARFGLQTATGERLYFLADDPQAEMFVDPEVRAKELVVEGWPRPKDHLELLHVYSLKDGRLHHLHYRCDLCNITAKAPGPCWCCRQPFELREVPLDGQPAAPPDVTTDD